MAYERPKYIFVVNSVNIDLSGSDATDERIFCKRTLGYTKTDISTEKSQYVVCCTLTIISLYYRICEKGKAARSLGQVRIAVVLQGGVYQLIDIGYRYPTQQS